MIKVVIFDSDGMLSHGPRFSEHYAREHGVDLSELAPFFTGPFKDCLVGKADLREELQDGGWLQKWKWEGNVDELLAYWFSVGDTLDQGIFDTVAAIRKIGIPCVLATNQEKYRTAYLSEKFGYEQAFNKVFSSAHVGHKKPSAEFFAEIEKYLRLADPSVTKSEILFWDDDSENVEGAAAYGFTVRQFVNEEQYKNEMKGLGFPIL